MKRTFADAKRICGRDGGIVLSSPISDYWNLFKDSIIKKYGRWTWSASRHRFWAGVTSTGGNSTTWTWTNGTQAEDIKFGNEDKFPCAVSRVLTSRFHTNLYWDLLTERCQQKYNYICQYAGEFLYDGCTCLQLLHFYHFLPRM